MSMYTVTTENNNNNRTFVIKWHCTEIKIFANLRPKKVFTESVQTKRKLEKSRIRESRLYRNLKLCFICPLPKRHFPLFSIENVVRRVCVDSVTVAKYMHDDVTERCPCEFSIISRNIY